MKSIVTAIGDHALDGKEPMIILFGEGATENLREYSVIQKFEEQQELAIKKGNQLKIDELVYTVEHVGSFANANLNSISHVTLIFDSVPAEDAVVNGIYLSPNKFPEINVGSIIEYMS
ncbi:PTS glucitol/sorbitol transporter subunit IIA [Enterococcus sp. LJL128]|uniref:PTS glucitol/sorbitol transporter subunit IIA n=1 Tax=Enterococcus sp. LJL51 TaxID=3416656 RepID=UPI003CFB9682